MLKRLFISLIISCFVMQISAQQSRIEGQLLVRFVDRDNSGLFYFSIGDQYPDCIIKSSTIDPYWFISLIYFDTSKVNGDELLRWINNSPYVLNAQYNHRMQLRVTPNDENYPSQWNMFNDGSGGGIADADIDAAEAWDLATGGVTNFGDTIVVAIVDDGFYLSHEDLSFYKNKNEIPLNGIDDDENGYVDDYDGWDATSHSGIIPVFNHGTHVSGIAGAIGNNGIGVAGVNWHVKILPVSCDVIESEVIEAYRYIYDQRKLYNETNGEKGAFIVSTNSSFGIDFVFPEDYPLWCAMYDSLGQVGILSAAATNNTMTNIDIVGDMPTGCSSDYLIAVTNTDKADNLKAAYGPINIDLGAPGSLIESTFPDNTYGLQTGTSMASPHVAGTVALMFDAACDKFLNDYNYNPAAMALLLKEYILESVDNIEDLASVTVSGGRLNANNAINKLLTDYCELSVDNNNNINQIIIYPNPATAFIYLSGFHPEINSGTISIIDLSGKIVTTSSTENNGVDISNLPDGFYLIRITDNNLNLIFTSTFVVQH